MQSLNGGHLCRLLLGLWSDHGRPQHLHAQPEAGLCGRLLIPEMFSRLHLQVGFYHAQLSWPGTGMNDLCGVSAQGRSEKALLPPVNTRHKGTGARSNSSSQG